MWVLNGLAAVGEAAWTTLGLPGRPPMTRTAVNLLFQEVTVIDRKARTELGYTSHVSIDQGLAELRADHLAGRT
jgi:nucleoside-diphosphate-sugar epimerase